MSLILNNIHCLGTQSSPLPHCHDTHAMQNLNGCAMPYSWWLEIYEINCSKTLMSFCGHEMNCIQKTLRYSECVYTFEGDADFCEISKIYKSLDFTSKET